MFKVVLIFKKRSDSNSARSQDSDDIYKCRFWLNLNVRGHQKQDNYVATAIAVYT